MIEKSFSLSDLYLVNVLWIMSDWNKMVEVLDEIKDKNIDKDDILEYYGHAYKG